MQPCNIYHSDTSYVSLIAEVNIESMQDEAKTKAIKEEYGYWSLCSISTSQAIIMQRLLYEYDQNYSLRKKLDRNIRKTKCAYMSKNYLYV